MAKNSDSNVVKVKDISDDWKEAFDPGMDYEASGDVNHQIRKVTGYLQKRWNEFAHGDVSSADKFLMTKDWEYSPKEGKDVVYGYIRTTNAMAINKLLYDPANAVDGTRRSLRVRTTPDSCAIYRRSRHWIRLSMRIQPVWTARIRGILTLSPSQKRLG